MNKIDLEIERLICEMDKFDENYRERVCNRLSNHRELHTNVIIYPSGAVFCDELRNAKSRHFRRKVYAVLSEVSGQKKETITGLRI